MLANEEVVDGKYVETGDPVEKVDEAMDVEDNSLCSALTR